VHEVALEARIVTLSFNLKEDHLKFTVVMDIYRDWTQLQILFNSDRIFLSFSRFYYQVCSFDKYQNGVVFENDP
jgi:hypothetical protein